MKYYLRVEAVNLGNFVYDTQDLSTIRGGGLLLLHMVEVLAVTPSVQLKPVTTGSSSGLFHFEADDEAGAQGVRQEIERVLREDSALVHATFVVDVLPAGPGGEEDRSTDENTPFINDRELLLAMNRWRQMRQPSVAVPARSPESGAPCRLDRLRPATESDPGKDDQQRMISRSVKRRREYGGQKQKAVFYEGLTGIKDRGFTREFNELTEIPWTELPAEGRWRVVPRNLNNKMAVIYFDGNSFGKIQDAVARGQEAQRRFDDDLKSRRRRLLKEVLLAMGRDETWRTPDEDYRLETLLWGGDEIIWVVPAWKGWELLTRFFELTRDWTVASPQGLIRLTHAAGLVFCHHNAPIRRIKDLAHGLVAEAKQRIPREENRFSYVILESFDHIVEGLDHYWEARCPTDRPEAGKDWILPAKALEKVARFVQEVKGTFPRRKLHQVVREFSRGSDWPDRARKTLRAALGELGQEAGDNLSALGAKACDPDLCWFHAAELWDYIIDPAEGP